MPSILTPWQSCASLSSVERASFQAAWIVLLFTLTELLVGELGGPRGIGQAPHTFAWTTTLYQPIVTSCWMAAFALFLCLPVSRAERLAVLAAGACLEVPLWLIRDDTRDFYNCFLLLGAGWGVVASAALARRAWATEGEERLRWLGYLAMATFMPLGKVIGGWTVIVIIQRHPQVYDLFGFALDESYKAVLGVNPAYAMGKLVYQSPSLYYFSYTIYSHLSLLMMLAMIASLRYPRRCPFNCTLAIVLAGMFGTMLYDVYPMAGYFYWPSGFPFGPAPPVPMPPFLIEATMYKARNCMPSLHAGWIFIVFFACRHMARPILVASWLSLIGTLLCTMYVGHYFIDLVVAVPFTLAVISLSAWKIDRWRLLGVVTGVALTTLCYLGIKGYPVFLATHGGLMTAITAALVVICVVAEHLLAARYLRAPEPETPSSPP